MRRIHAWILVIGVLAIGSSCEITFNTTLEYNISGTSDSVEVRYTGSGDDLVDVTVSSPWSTSFTLWSGHDPFLAFIRVQNNGSADVTVYIREDETTITSGTATAGGPSIDLYAIIE
jgi:hypothetical protein